MSFEIVALFPGSSLIKSRASFLEIVSKEKVSLPKFSFIFLQLSSFPKFIFPVDSRKFKTLAIFVKNSLKVFEIFFLPLRVSFFSVKIMLSVVLHLSEKKGLTVFFFLSFELTSVYSNGYDGVAYTFASFDLFLLNVFHSLDHFMIALRSVLLIKT